MRKILSEAYPNETFSSFFFFVPPEKAGRIPRYYPGSSRPVLSLHCISGKLGEVGIALTKLVPTVGKFYNPFSKIYFLCLKKKYGNT